MGAQHSAVVCTKTRDGRDVTAHYPDGNFRHILHTTANSQVGFMQLAAGQVLKLEVHEKSDQYFIITAGRGRAELRVAAGRRFVTLDPGVVLMVDAGTPHEITAETPVQLVVIYAKPNHPEGTVHRTDPEA